MKYADLDIQTKVKVEFKLQKMGGKETTVRGQLTRVQVGLTEARGYEPSRKDRGPIKSLVDLF